MRRGQVRRKVLDYPAKGGKLPSGAASFINDTYMKKPSAGGFGRAIGLGLGLGVSLFMTDYRQKYGTGFAIMHGVAASTPLLWIGVAAAEAGIGAMDYGYHKYHERRRLNMGRPMIDSQGTINAMKQNSLHKMQRGHNSIYKTIGNEARYMHG